jgi:nucleotide-binding universal stress UspA family protein
LDRRQAAREALHEWVAPLRDQGVEHRTEVVDGSPASALDKVATRENADLIVVGRRGEGGFAELLLGSVPHALAHHAHRPVVIIPATQGSER